MNGETCELSASTIHLRYESQQELNAKFIVIISVTVNAVYCHRPGGVKRIPPDTAITRTNGYVKVCITTSTPSTSLRPIVDNDKSDTTHNDMRNMQN